MANVEHPNLLIPSVKYRKFAINNIDIDFSKVVELVVEESLDYPGISGRIFIQDFDDVKGQTGVIGSDPIDIELVIRQQELLITGSNYVVTDGHGDEITTVDTSVFNPIALSFETRWSVNAFNMKVTRAYTKANCPAENEGRGWRISEIVQDLVEVCGGTMGIVVETEGIIERFITPKWTVMESLNYLMSFAHQKTETAGVRKGGGYMLWTNIAQNRHGYNEVNFAPMDFLLQDEDNYNETDETLSTDGLVDETKLTTWAPYQFSPRRIHKIEVSQSFDSSEAVDKGICNSTTMGFNFDEGIPIAIEIKASTFKQNHITTGMPLNKVYTHKDFGTLKSTLLYPNTDTIIAKPLRNVEGDRDFTGTLFVEGRASTKESLLLSDLIQLDIVTEGDPESKKIGRQVRVAVPRATSGNKEDSQLSGIYIVKDNVHIIRTRYYANSITVMREGYKDLVNENALLYKMDADDDDITDSDVIAHVYQTDEFDDLDIIGPT